MKTTIPPKKHDDLIGEEEWKGKYLRALADYQNLEKRITAVRSEETKLAHKNIILKILPAIDALEKAERHLSDQGLSLAIKMLKDVLKGEQVEKIEVIGKKFDPYFMECVEIKGDGKDEIVSEEIRPGYKIFDQVLRVAKVKVGKTENKMENEKQVKN